MQLSHIISFYSIDKPTLVYWGRYDDKEKDRKAEEISEEMDGYWKLSSTGRKACIGYRHEAGMKKCLLHICNVPQCRRCSWLDIARVHTRLDFTAHEHLREKFVSRPYSIYLASFGNLIKCGVTKKERVHDRVREQGADAWAEIMRFENGEEAYEAESGLQHTFGFKNAVRADTKLKLLSAKKENDGREKSNKETIEHAIERMKQNDEFNSSLLSKIQITQEDYHLPKEWEVADANSISGKILTAKGSLLFYEADDKEANQIAKVVNMKKMRGSLVEISR